MKKFETRYISENFDDATDLTIIVNNQAINSDHIRLEYYRERWRSKAEAIRFYTWIIKQLKSFEPRE